MLPPVGVGHHGVPGGHHGYGGGRHDDAVRRHVGQVVAVAAAQGGGNGRRGAAVVQLQEEDGGDFCSVDMHVRCHPRDAAAADHPEVGCDAELVDSVFVGLRLPGSAGNYDAE